MGAIIIRRPILIPSSTTLLVDSKENPHPLVLNKTLISVAWQVSGMDYLSNLSREFLRKQHSLLSSQEGKVPWEIVNRPGKSGLVDSWKVDSFRCPLNYVLDHLSSLFYHEKLLYTIMPVMFILMTSL